ncbi:MAG: c-type cytochrome [Deltaproteobacteria bacterium]|nr:c-type cytochrome [Deltaproteobacteria bacterium]
MAEKDKLLDHEYDGITEYDNPLPNWWLWLFYLSIIFAVVYIPYIGLGLGPSSIEEYQMEIAAAMKAPAGQPGGEQTAGAAPEQAAPASLEGNAEAIAEGQKIFLASCLPCHGPDGRGTIGPNLTDNFWLHGNTYNDIVITITNGVPEKGMIPWKTMLNPTKILQVAAFVKSIKGTNPPEAKPPQGKEYPE